MVVVLLGDKYFQVLTQIHSIQVEMIFRLNLLQHQRDHVVQDIKKAFNS